MKIGRVDAVWDDLDLSPRIRRDGNDGPRDILADRNDPVRMAQGPMPEQGARRIAVVTHAMFGAYHRQTVPQACSDGENVRTVGVGMKKAGVFLGQDAPEPSDVGWSVTAP